MTDPNDDGERSIRSWLRNKIDGPVEEATAAPLVEVHVIPEHAAPDDQDDEEQEQPEPERPWWHVVPGPRGTRTAPAPEPTQQQTIAAAPGIHVTVNQPVPEPAAPAEDERARERRRRRQMWGIYHGSAAAVGWWTGLCDQMSELLTQAGHSAPVAGLVMAAVTYIVASYLPGLPYMPPALRPVTVWAARIPVSTAVLALCLYAPGHF
ncbi:hypothetical protein OG244_19520 [Streptomyces brevispora]|uniref:hypothetical protein n=1 Tax=Streptomyces brevispora TaxID=887462 RepID=UPI002E302C97|nr:hypothetical protein [Streptomyces brevispora]